MPNFDQTGPTGQGPTGKGLGGCRRNMSTENSVDKSFSGGMGRRSQGSFNKGQGRCSGGRGQCQGNRKRGQAWR